ncbi:hypothetical protein HDU85_000284 [Gaertneriomyces sp. JEL0708]|nr:hypothetical protein HDU85_000284 [Gaertneriomyces sp. JEL0708]
MPFLFDFDQADGRWQYHVHGQPLILELLETDLQWASDKLPDDGFYCDMFDEEGSLELTLCTPDLHIPPQYVPPPEDFEPQEGNKWNDVDMQHFKKELLLDDPNIKMLP